MGEFVEQSGFDRGTSSKEQWSEVEDEPKRMLMTTLGFDQTPRGSCYHWLEDE